MKPCALILLFAFASVAQELTRDSEYLTVKGYVSENEVRTRSEQIVQSNWSQKFINDPNRVTRYAYPWRSITNAQGEITEWELVISDGNTNRLSEAEKTRVVVRTRDTNVVEEISR